MPQLFEKVTARYKPRTGTHRAIPDDLVKLEGQEAKWIYLAQAKSGPFEGVWSLATEDERWRGRLILEIDLEILTPTPTN